jgi:hypothetical protein
MGLQRAARVLAFIAACVPLVAAAKPTEHCLIPGTDLDFPPSVAGFVRVSAEDYESSAPGGGCSVRYQNSPAVWIDVYVYNPFKERVADAPRDEQLLQLFRMTAAGISQGWAKNGATVHDLHAAYEWRGSRRMEVMVATASIETRDKNTLSTYLQVWPAAGVVWKMRMTVESKEYDDAKPRILAVADALVDLSQGDAK